LKIHSNTVQVTTSNYFVKTTNKKQFKRWKYSFNTIYIGYHRLVSAYKREEARLISLQTIVRK